MTCVCYYYSVVQGMMTPSWLVASTSRMHDSHRVANLFSVSQQSGSQKKKKKKKKKKKYP
jgi:hypothetical protein